MPGSLACCLLLFWLLPPGLQLSSCSMVRSLTGTSSYLSGVIVALQSQAVPVQRSVR